MILDLNTEWKQRRPKLVIKTDQIVFSGYQSFILSDSIVPLSKKLKRKFNLIQRHLDKISGLSCLDLGCANMFFGFYCYINGAAVDAVEVDSEYIKDIRRICDEKNFNINVHQMNIEGYTKPADIVFALSIIHWLYSCSASFMSLESVIVFLSSLSKRFMFIEWVGPEDRAILKFNHLGYNNNETKKDYSFDVFHDSLKKQFDNVVRLGSVSKTRSIYLCSRNL
jgi:hypothetical protein